MHTESKILKDQPYSPQELLGYTYSELLGIGGFYTAKEIDQQPHLWKKIWQLLDDKQEELASFLKTAFQEDGMSILLTGAGTSAFIGNVLQGIFQKNTGISSAAIPSTDLVLYPEQYFNKRATLLVSFARSGDSPESLAAVKIANEVCDKVYHLIITCNPLGQLLISSEIGNKNTYVILLPKEANDKGLAMTGSFTSMLLTGLLISRIDEMNALKSQVDILSQAGSHILHNYSQSLRKVAKLHFHRAIFLGSGPLRSVAQESDLKLQELTDGQVICKSDSFLGFRHGPKAVINPATLLVYLFSNNRHVHLYEKDLTRDISKGEKGILRIGIIEKNLGENLDVDLLIEMSPHAEEIQEEFLTVLSVIPAQILGFYKSIDFGLAPDMPSRQETITRVVRGVTIYPFPK
ncbi:SIS domain-containing protein [Dyadobacter tibetensis]|uniref:SIS domain-containing protein n=1 Tax=Dyadobacter tibetensis TaxID=1211851 RepID=UPI0004B2323A|nr:SIS domain-containing protein [Dyadobacter tibetensis]